MTWYANSFDGWGTSLAWFVNATGSLGEESAITTNLGDDASKAKAVEYGKQLREQFYQSIFGDEGLDLNMARYNVGGGNASDVAYGYPFMRQGAAVPGTWKDDATGSGTYGNGVTTKQADKDKLAAAFDPTDDNQYDFSKSAAQDWWIERGATGDNPDITDVEAFANSAPWFLTNSGYATGGRNSGSNNLANPEKFAQYMAKNVEHLESLGANVDTVEPFNESETSYWGTPGDMASKYTDESDDNTKLINNYWDKYYSDKDKSVTPYSNALKKPQEGMHVSNAQQQQTITALAEALKDNDDTIIAATDVYGNEFNVAATVYVGALTVSDPVSATVLAGTSASEAKAALEAAPVYLHVKASPAFEGDAAKVTWNFDGLDTKLADAKAGDNIAVTGTYQLDDATTIALKGAIYVTAATPENVADTASSLTVTNQQTEYSKGDQWKKLTDGDTSAEAWVTWNSAGDYSASPTATIDFGSECELSSVTITYGDKAPASAKAEYTTDGETWMQFGSDVKPAAGQTVTFKADKGTVNATKVRIVNTVNNDYMNATEIQAFVTPVQGAAKNIAAASGTNFSVNFQESASASKAIDGDTTSKGWSTWASTASTVDPVATFTFDEAQTITEVKTFFYYDGRASWPKSQTLEYQDEAGEWHGVGTKDGWKIQAGDAGSGSDGITAADTPTVDFVLGTPVKAKAIRLTNTLQDTKVYINVAEIQVFAQDSTVLTPQPASDATLGDLRLDGETVEGFDPAKTDYTVDLPVDAEANPVLQAFATDNAAAVKVTGDAVENGKLGGKAAITVTSADESETKTYTVTFNAFTLASLKVIGPTKTEYAIGDKLDTAGLKVTAVYQSGDKTKEVPVALDDPQLAIGSFDSTTAGKKAITVSYRGVTATFNVTVKANAVAPGPEGQKPGNTNKPGATGNGNKNTVANTGSSVAAIAGAVALLAAAAGALFMLRKRA